MPWTPSSGKNNDVRYEWFHSVSSMCVPHRAKLSYPKLTGKKTPTEANNKNMQPLNAKSKENRGKNTLCLRHTAISVNVEQW